MPTLIEIPEPAIPSQLKAADTCAVGPKKERDPAPAPPLSGHVLFSDSLLERSSSERHRRGMTTTFSFALQCLLVGFLFLLPLMFTEALPTQQLLALLVAPPPPPPPPPPAAAPVARVVETDMLNNGQLRTPTRIPPKVESIHEEEAPPPAFAGGVIGGVPGGVPGGQLGGVIGGIIASSSKSQVVMPKLEPVKRIRISQGVIQGMIVTKIPPIYPKIAITARISGVVLLHAIISKEGAITELQAVSGHPVLIPAAIDAVKQWRYRPYLLNGVPVEVETYVTVTFDLSG
jgi:periplasmic protein TonB